MATANPTASMASARAARIVKPKLGRDDWIMRGFMLMIGLYLIITLALPLYAMFSKSFEIRVFDYEAIEVSIDEGTGWSEPVLLSEIAEEQGLENERTQARSSTVITGATIFGGAQDDGIERYRFRSLDASSQIDVNLEPIAQGQWAEVDSDNLRRVIIRAGTIKSFGNYLEYFSTPALFQSIYNSVFVSLMTTVITILLAFGFAYCLTRTNMPGKTLFRTVAMVPILVPSLLAGLSLVYLFGNQGIIKNVLMGAEIYGPLGIVIGSVFFTFPHALLIIVTALSISDARLYEAAQALRTSPWKTFWTVTIPGARFGLISAAFVVFTLTITDFGVPKVIGGQYNVLAVDIYKQVVGQQNFSMGAVVSVILLVPAVLAFVVDRMVTSKQVALLSARAVPYHPKANARADSLALIYCVVISLLLLTVIAMAQYAALIQFWPYNHTISLKWFDFGKLDGGGWPSYFNSIRMALYSAVIGVIVVFIGAYLVEKGRGTNAGRSGLHFLAMMPMAIPGMVLGLSYIFFFNDPNNPLNFLYGTMAILVICTITHFYTVSHLTALTALKAMDREFESVSASLKQPVTKVFGQVTVPVCMPAILDIAIYYFVNAMTTVSAVIFLYSPHTTLAAVAALNMDDAGQIQGAAAMCMMIFYTNVLVKVIHVILSWWLGRSTQAWRKR